MPAVSLWLPEIPTFVDQNGAPLSGAALYFYATGSSTKLNTYTTSAGTIANANPMTLDSAGRVPGPVWLQTGSLYKVGLADSTQPDPPSVFIWIINDVSGIPTATSSQGSEWIASGFAPTYVSGTSFTVPGDQTSTLDVGRRLQIIDAGGTKYSTITASVFTTLTTVTVQTDTTTLSSPIASVAYGLLDPAHPSVSPDLVNQRGNSIVSAATTNIWATNGNELHVVGSTGPITSFGTALSGGNYRWVIFDNTPTITAGASLQIQGIASGAGVTVAAGDRWLVIADSTTSMLVTRFPIAPVPLLPRDYIDGFALTTASTTTYDIAAGATIDSTNTINIIGPAIAGKSQATWAAGASAGGKLSAAAMANATWYYWFALLKDADQSVDFGFDVATTPTLPSGYTKYRIIGARKTAAGATTWETFIQHGDEVFWSTPPALDINGAALSTANRTLTTVAVPAYRVKWMGAFVQQGSGSVESAILTDPLCADIAPSSNATPLGSVVLAGVAGVQRVGGQVACWTNAASQIGARGLTGQSTYMQTYGWVDPRGKPV